ncbi:hypothetical protein VPHK225_0032 [Vibrio phage K225]
MSYRNVLTLPDSAIALDTRRPTWYNGYLIETDSRGATNV